MKKLFASLAASLVLSSVALAQTPDNPPTSGLTQAAADARYCKLAGCTMTGAFVGTTIALGGATIGSWKLAIAGGEIALITDGTGLNWIDGTHAIYKETGASQITVYTGGARVATFKIANIGLTLPSTSAVGWSDTGNSVSASDTAFSRISAALVAVGNGTPGDFSGALKLATATLTTLATDATHTDNSVCVDSVSGLLYKGSGAIGVCLGTSSARYKRAIIPQVDGLAAINALTPVNYRYIKGYGDDGAREQYGFLAEDVVHVLPKLVGLDSDGRPNSVDIVGMVPVIVSAIQELQAEIEALKRTR